MLGRFRSRLSYANVMSTLAALFALAGGTAYAVNEWTGANIVNESLTGADVRGRPGTSTRAAVNGSLTTDDIAGQPAKAANGTPFIDGSLTQWDIKDGTLVNADLANNAVNAAKVADNTLGGRDIADGTVGSVDIADGNLIERDIEPNTLTGNSINESTLGQVPSALLGGFGRSGAITSCDPETTFFEFCAGTEILDVPSGARALVLGRTLAQPDPGSTSGIGDCVLMTSSIGQVPNTFQRVTAEGFGLSATLVGVTPPLPEGGTSFGILCRDTGGEGGGIQYPEISASAVVISGN